MTCSSTHLPPQGGSLFYSCFPAWSYPALQLRTLVLSAVAGCRLTLPLRVAEGVLLLGPKTL